jgi:anti-sigma B factor antagonist
MFHQTNQGAVAVIAGAAPLNHESADEARSLLQRCFSGGQPMAVFDLENVSLIDSAGLEMLLDAQEEFAWRGGALKLAAPTPLCRDILHLTGLDRRFEVYENTRSAVGSFLK